MLVKQALNYTVSLFGGHGGESQVSNGFCQVCL